MSDLLDGIAEIRHKFLMLNIEPPSILIFDSHEQGLQILAEIRQSPFMQVTVGSGETGKTVRDETDKMWMEITVMGMKLRWPARKISLPAGGFGYV